MFESIVDDMKSTWSDILEFAVILICQSLFNFVV